MLGLGLSKECKDELLRATNLKQVFQILDKYYITEEINTTAFNQNLVGWFNTAFLFLGNIKKRDDKTKKNTTG